MKQLWVSLGLCVGLGTTAFAKSYECKPASGPKTKEQMRYVEIKPLGKAPCDVVYTKDGQSKVTHHADHDAKYCEKSAETFAKVQLKSLGWDCEETKAESSAPAEKPVSPESPSQESIPAQ